MLPFSPPQGNGRAERLRPGEEPASEYDDRLPASEDEAEPLPVMSCAKLLRTYPERRAAVIEGLLRVGETMNIIAAPKIGKSWLSLGLAFAVATGGKWLSTFQTTQGKVLLIDNELHPETSAHRLRTLAATLHVPLDDIADRVSILNLRGRLMDLRALGRGLQQIGSGQYKLVIIDAFYRTLPIGTDENDNGKMADLYNHVDQFGNHLGAAFALIHHASKGDQSAKSVTDVGAGPRTVPRATDTHLILRPHEENNAVVLDAAVRSWPPVNPLCMRWDFPVWSPAPDLDPSLLRTPKPKRRKPDGEGEPEKPKEPPWDAKRFAAAFGKTEPQPRGAILETANLLGVSDRKAVELLNRAVDCGLLFSWKERGANSKTLYATVRPPDPPPAAPEPVAIPEEVKPTKAKRSPKNPRRKRRK